MANVYYQRNKLANILGISKETLRYYEDKHIIEPKRDPVNGYRVYDEMDCQTLVSLRILRSYGYSLEDAISSEIGFGDLLLEKRLDQRIEAAELEIQRLSREKQILIELKNESRLWREKPHIRRFEKRNEHVFFLEQLYGWTPIVDAERNQAVKILTSTLPVTFHGMILDSKFVLEEEYSEEVPDHSGIFWFASDLDVLPAELQGLACDCEYQWNWVLHGVEEFDCADQEDWSDLRQSLKEYVAFIHKSGYEISSDIVLRILPVSLGSKVSFLEIIVPVEKTEDEQNEETIFGSLDSCNGADPVLRDGER